MKLKEMLRPERSSISPWSRRRPGNWRRRNNAALLAGWMAAREKD